MTELEMLEAEKYWCENCCNWDKEHVQMDGYAKCKLTGTLCFCQESGKDCKCFNVPAENVIAPPCKVGDKVYEAIPKGGCIRSLKVVGFHLGRFPDLRGHKRKEYLVCYSDYSLTHVDIDKFGKTVFLTKEEAEEALGGVQG